MKSAGTFLQKPDGTMYIDKLNELHKSLGHPSDKRMTEITCFKLKMIETNCIICSKAVKPKEGQ